MVCLQTGALTMAGPSQESNTSADATLAASQRFALVQHNGRQPAMATAARDGSSSGPEGPGQWQGLALTPTVMTGVTGDSDPSDAASAGSAPCGRLQTQARRHATTKQSADDAAAGGLSVAVSDTQLSGLPVLSAAELLGSDLTSLQLTLALAQYPEGARVLHAANRDFLLVPLSNVVDESYSGYLDLVSRRFQVVEA